MVLCQSQNFVEVEELRYQIVNLGNVHFGLMHPYKQQH